MGILFRWPRGGETVATSSGGGGPQCARGFLRAIRHKQRHWDTSPRKPGSRGEDRVLSSVQKVTEIPCPCQFSLGAIKTVGQERGQLVRANPSPSVLARTSCPRSWP